MSESECLDPSNPNNTHWAVTEGGCQESITEGPCPLISDGESGACCDGESCFISPSSFDCTGSTGGTFMGVGTVCSPNPCEET